VLSPRIGRIQNMLKEPISKGTPRNMQTTGNGQRDVTINPINADPTIEPSLPIASVQPPPDARKAVG
jgi:hypothetical protein